MATTCWVSGKLDCSRFMPASLFLFHAMQQMVWSKEHRLLFTVSSVGTDSALTSGVHGNARNKVLMRNLAFRRAGIASGDDNVPPWARGMRLVVSRSSGQISTQKFDLA